MGVLSLWKLLERCGRTVQLESLANRRLAIDLSIWLHSFIKAMRDHDGQMVDNAHLRGLFSRVCKLLFFGVRPIFVFDGITPTLKKNTTARRSRARQAAEKKSQYLAERILLNQLQQEHLAQLARSGVEPTTKKINASHSTTTATTAAAVIVEDSSVDESKEIELDDMVDDENIDNYNELFEEKKVASQPRSQMTAQGLESLRGHLSSQYNLDLGAVSVESAAFKSLPEEVKVEVLHYLKQMGFAQTRQIMRDVSHSTNTTPSSFSDLQMQQFLTRGKIGNQMRSLKKTLDQGPKSIASSATGTYIFARNDTDRRNSMFSSDSKASEVKLVRSTTERKVLDAETAAEFEKLSSWINDGDDGALVEEEVQDDELLVVIDDEEDKSDNDEIDQPEVIDLDLEAPAVKRPKIMADLNGMELHGFEDDEDEFLADEFESHEEAEQAVKSKPIGMRSQNAMIEIDDSGDENDEMVVEVDLNEHKTADGDGDSLENQLVQEFFAKATSTPTTPAKSPKTSYRKTNKSIATPVITIDDSNESDRSAPPSPSKPEVLLPLKPKYQAMRIQKFTEPIELESNEEKFSIEAQPAEPAVVVVQEEEKREEEKEAEARKDPDLVSEVETEHPSVQLIETMDPTPVPKNVIEHSSYPIISSSSSAREKETLDFTELATPHSSLIRVTTPPPSQQLSATQTSRPEVHRRLSTPKASQDEELLAELRENAEIPVDESSLWPPPQIEAMERELQLEKTALVENRRRESARAQTVDDIMILECQELLRLFGVPFIVSPTEADAQCAALEMLGYADGVVSDDNDIFLFGGRHVFRHAFKPDMFMELYDMKEIESELGVGRDDLIGIAMLVGSDYTEGVDGIGLKTAEAIGKVFKGENGMKEFKEWIETGKEKYDTPEAQEFYHKYARLRDRIELETSFPNPDVIRGYKSPYINSDTNNFEWTCPDLESLRHYASEKFGWTIDTTDSKLLPVVKRYTKALDVSTTDSNQAKITTFFMKTANNQPVFNNKKAKKDFKTVEKQSNNAKKRKR